MATPNDKKNSWKKNPLDLNERMRKKNRENSVKASNIRLELVFRQFNFLFLFLFLLKETRGSVLRFLFSPFCGFPNSFPIFFICPRGNVACRPSGRQIPVGAGVATLGPPTHHPQRGHRPQPRPSDSQYAHRWR